MSSLSPLNYQVAAQSGEAAGQEVTRLMRELEEAERKSRALQMERDRATAARKEAEGREQVTGHQYRNQSSWEEKGGEP